MRTDHVDWPATAARGFPFPAGVPAARIAAELDAMLVSPDPEVRDDQAYTAAARWIEQGRLDPVLTALGDAAAGRLTHPEVQARTFAPLILRCVLARGVERNMDREAAERWYPEFTAWYPAEQDTRGWDDGLGWLHAVAHGADAAAAFALALPDRAADLLTLCARRMTAETGYRYVQFEDARLARAITRILAAPGLTDHQATAWLDTVTAALEGGGPGAVPPWAFNTFATLQSLHLHLTHGLAGSRPAPHARTVTRALVPVLRLPFPWLAAVR